MTKGYLKLPSRPTNYAPRISSRRMGFRDFVNICYKEDGGADPSADEIALLEKVKQKVTAELQTRGLTADKTITDLVQSAVDTSLKGLKLEALRSIEDNFDAKKLTDSVVSLSTQMEKLKNQPAGQNAMKLQALRSMLDDKKTMDRIEKVYNSREPNQEVILSTRAAVTMTTQNVVNDGDIPEDILNSFSVDTFVKKRRSKEYIWEIVSRRTVAKITEYKTWLEEGTEDGAFAIVAEGGLKPLVSKTLVRNVSKYRKIAGKRVYTEEFAKFRTEAYGIIEDLFNDQLLRNYNAILVTSLNTWSAAYVSTALNAQYTTPTDYHAIGAVAAQIEALDFEPDLLLLNPQDKWRIGLTTDTTGQFLVNIPQLNPQTGVVTMMGFRVFTSNQIPVGTFRLGESGLYKVEDEPVTVRIGYGITVVGNNPVTSVESDFDNNRFRIIAETFFHNYVATAHTGSWVSASFAAVKALLLKP